MTAILGISAFYHDSAAALVVDGQIVAAAAEERFSRFKRDASFPTHAIRYCLDQAGIAAAQEVVTRATFDSTNALRDVSDRQHQQRPKLHLQIFLNGRLCSILSNSKLIESGQLATVESSWIRCLAGQRHFYQPQCVTGLCMVLPKSFGGDELHYLIDRSVSFDIAHFGVLLIATRYAEGV